MKGGGDTEEYTLGVLGKELQPLKRKEVMRAKGQVEGGGAGKWEALGREESWSRKGAYAGV